MTSYKVLELQRKNPHTGYIEKIVYTGSKKNKPKGWKIIRERWVSVATDENGLTGKHF